MTPSTAIAAVVLAAVAALSGSAQAMVPVPSPLPKIDIAIVGAIFNEFNALYGIFDASPAPQNFTKYGRFFSVGYIANKSAVIVACGVGMTNSAMTTTMLVDMYDMKYMLFSGIAGGTTPTHRVGDVVIPKSWFNIHHQKMIRTVPVSKGPKKGKPTNLYFEHGRDFPNKFVLNATGYPVSLTATRTFPATVTKADRLATGGGVEFHKGFAIPMEVETLKVPSDVFMPTPPTIFQMPVSQVMWDAAQTVAASGNVKLIRSAVVDGVLQDIGYDPIIDVTPFPGASASTFLDNKEYREALFRTFKTQAFEMEGAAFLHVCQSMGKECLVIRTLSDLAGGDVAFNVIRIFLDFASINTAAVTKELVKTLPF